jgi:hypothetical protein
MLTMKLVLQAGMPECVALRAYDCNKQSAQIEQYSLPDPEPCGNMEKVHVIERELYGEILQIKKECLVQVTRCTASQTRQVGLLRVPEPLGVERYENFHEPIVIEPADC